MARLVEGSDEEFPELAVIIRKQERCVKKDTVVENSMQTLLRRPVRDESVLKVTAELPSNLFDTSLEALGSPAISVYKPRAWNQDSAKICEDTHLISLGRQMGNMTSSIEMDGWTLDSDLILTNQKAHMGPTVSRCSKKPFESDDEEVSSGDSIGLSDFIVNDKSPSEKSSTDEEIQSRPSKPKRRLIRGRRSSRSHSSQDYHSKSSNDILSEKSMKTPPLERRSIKGGEGEEGSLKILKNGPLDANPWGRCIVTPPTSPQKTGKRLLSPKKGPRIPMTPHRPSMDAFWDPDVINDWNEEYSPKKTPNLHHHNHFGTGSDDWNVKSPLKRNQLTRDQKRQQAKKSFALKKHNIAETFLRELDERITDGRISEMAAPTGGIKIVWSKKLNTTAGRANWKRETMRSSARCADGNTEISIIYRHYASVELAEKVIDDEERLLNVIAHEFCHLANFMVSGIRNNPHGKEFKVWAAKCSNTFGERGISVTTKHSYDIDYKYIWECTNCGTEFKRHSKSIDPVKHQCGSCRSKLMQIKPVPRANLGASKYQLFVKQNMRIIKEQNPGSSQKQIMTIVGKMYQEQKASKLGNDLKVLERTVADKVKDLESREESPKDSDINLVMRKLKLLNMRSPCND